MLPAELTWITGQAQPRPCWHHSRWSWDTRNCSGGAEQPQDPPQHPTGTKERRCGKPTPISKKGLNKLQPGEYARETGQVGHTWSCTLLEELGKDHSMPVPSCCSWPWLLPCSAPAQPPAWDQPGAVQAPQESNSSSDSVHVPSPQQSSETDPSCTSHPSQAAPEPLPFQVLQQEEEGDEVGVRQRAEKVHHAVLLGSRIRESWRQRGRGLRTGSAAAAGPTTARYLPAATV